MEEPSRALQKDHRTSSKDIWITAVSWGLSHEGDQPLPTELIKQAEGRKMVMSRVSREPGWEQQETPSYWQWMSGHGAHMMSKAKTVSIAERGVGALQGLDGVFYFNVVVSQQCVDVDGITVQKEGTVSWGDTWRTNRASSLHGWDGIKPSVQTEGVVWGRTAGKRHPQMKARIVFRALPLILCRHTCPSSSELPHNQLNKDPAWAQGSRVLQGGWSPVDTLLTNPPTSFWALSPDSALGAHRKSSRFHQTMSLVWFILTHCFGHIGWQHHDPGTRHTFC